MGMNLYFFRDSETTLCHMRFNACLNFMKSTLCLFKKREVAIEHSGRNVEYPSLLFVHCYQFFSCVGEGEYTSDIPSLWKPFLLFFMSFAMFSSCFALAFLIPSPLLSFVPHYSSQDTCPCFSAAWAFASFTLV